MSTDAGHPAYTRRHFLGMTGASLALATLPACSAIIPTLNPNEPFDVAKFDRWYRYAKLYNGVNPNLRSPHRPARTGYTFLDNITKGYTPGVGYSMPMNEVMVAVAPGVVFEFGNIRGTGRAEGVYIRMQHPRVGPFMSEFAHVGEMVCDPSKPIHRGQPICKVPMQYADIAKLIFFDNGWQADPDNYGPDHGFMRYGDDQPAAVLDLSRDETIRRFDVQTKVLAHFDAARVHRDRDPLREKLHNPGGYKPTTLSSVELFRYLSAMYEMYPQEFPTLPRAEFEVLKTEFYAHQPIILTLPLKKP